MRSRAKTIVVTVFSAASLTALGFQAAAKPKCVGITCVPKTQVSVTLLRVSEDGTVEQADADTSPLGLRSKWTAVK